VDGNFSGVPDDRWAFTTKEPRLQYGAAASLAAASQALKGWDDTLANLCLETAIKMWDEEHAHPTAILAPPGQGPPANFAGQIVRGEEWEATLELLTATNSDVLYKKRIMEMLPLVRQGFAYGGWTVLRAIPYMDADFKKQLEEIVRSYVAQLDTELAATPFGASPSRGGWGRLDRRIRSRHPDVFSAQGIPRNHRHGLLAARRQLHAGHASGIEHVVCFLGRDGFEAEGLWKQPC
jgi:endoglucanase